MRSRIVAFSRLCSKMSPVSRTISALIDVQIRAVHDKNIFLAGLQGHRFIMGIVIEGEYSTTQGNNFQRMRYQGMSTSAELFGGRYGNTSRGDVADDLPAVV